MLHGIAFSFHNLKSGSAGPRVSILARADNLAGSINGCPRMSYPQSNKDAFVDVRQAD